MVCNTGWWPLFHCKYQSCSYMNRILRLFSHPIIVQNERALLGCRIGRNGWSNWAWCCCGNENYLTAKIANSHMVGLSFVHGMRSQLKGHSVLWLFKLIYLHLYVHIYAYTWYLVFSGGSLPGELYSQVFEFWKSRDGLPRGPSQQGPSQVASWFTSPFRLSITLNQEGL